MKNTFSYSLPVFEYLKNIDKQGKVKLPIPTCFCERNLILRSQVRQNSKTVNCIPLVSFNQLNIKVLLTCLA